MRAAWVEEYGPPGVVRVTDVPSRALHPREVRVRVAAAAVNFPDVLLVANQYQLTVPTPFVPGSEFAGTVTEVSDGVDKVAVGDAVFGATMVGAFAQEVIVGPDGLARVPDGVDTRLAAAFGVAHRTAFHALHSVGHMQEGDDVVVLGAGGGVGLAAVQLAVAYGARVTAIASSDEKLAVAKAYGATHTIDRRAGDVRAALRELLPQGADVVIDPVGGDVSEPALRALHTGGRFVVVGFASGEIPRIALNLVLLKGISVVGFQMRDFLGGPAVERAERELLDLLGSGRVQPHIGASFALDDVAAALQYVADGKAIGKVILDI
jgi:NADPH:quinone reductase-like Zn-dependent oxidoreductase